MLGIGVRARRLGDLQVELERGGGLAAGVGVVLGRLHPGGGVGPAAGDLEHPHDLAAADDDVQAAVVEPLDHLDQLGGAAQLAGAVVVGEEEGELLAVPLAVSDQPPVAVLEDVERHELARNEDCGERKQADLASRHGIRTVVPLSRRDAAALSSGSKRRSDVFDAIVGAERLEPALAAATRRSAAAAAAAGTGMSPPPSAGVLVLDSDLDVRASTAAARAWLGQLLPPSMEFADVAAMAVVYNVASRALARSATGGGDHAGDPARVRVRSATGAWAIVEADRLDPLEGTVAVTIRPAAAQDVLDLRLLAYDLTARERQVVMALLDGSDTRAVSQRLFLSPHTVNDHLKAIFAKVGVRTRKELTAMLAAPPCEPAGEARRRA